MKVKPIREKISPQMIPNVLLIGNGISMAAKRSSSWEKLIKSALKNNNVEYKYSKIKSLPANMQIVVATKNHVNTELKSIVNPMFTKIDSDSSIFLKEIADIPVQAILNTNYDYDIEQAFGINAGKHQFQNCRCWTKEIKKGTNDKKYNLFQYSDVNLNDNSKKIWHIHGDICSPKYMIMGHRYYGSLLHQIHNYVPTFFAQYNQKIRNGEVYFPKSWVDYFLTGNIFILGFGMYSTESDLWWLLDCKREHFKDTKVYYYTPTEKIDNNTKVLLCTYGVEIIDYLPFEENKYKEFYLAAIKDIEKRINEQNSK